MKYLVLLAVVLLLSACTDSPEKVTQEAPQEAVDKVVVKDEMRVTKEMRVTGEMVAKNEDSMPSNENHMTKHDNGLITEIITPGEGAVAEEGDNVRVHYVGTLEDGSKFDSSRDREEPFNFTVGAEQVIKGWDQGVEGMQVGEIRKLTVPSDLGYGDSGFPPVIPPRATLIFEVELLEIVESPLQRGEVQ